MRLLSLSILTLGILAYMLAAQQPALTTEAFYAQKCANCHAVDGSGSTKTGQSLKVRDFRSAEVQKMTDKELLEVTTKGKGKMPAFAKQMDQKALDDMLKHVRQLGKSSKTKD